MQLDMYLFFDTETTGLPRNWKAPISQLSNWPRVVQLAWLLYDEEEQLLEAQDYIVYPQDFQIPASVVRIHGISQAKALAEGIPIHQVLDQFLQSLDQAEVLVAHNISFDQNILGAELLRANYPNSLATMPSICTMRSTANYCRIPNKYGYKWPTLSELHYSIFRKGFKNAHNAAVDIQITAKCFWALRKMGHI